MKVIKRLIVYILLSIIFLQALSSGSILRIIPAMAAIYMAGFILEMAVPKEEKHD